MYAPTRREITGKLRWITVMLVVLMAGCSGTGIFAPVSNLSDLGVDGTYRIQPGDTLSSISRETGVSVERLASLNNISNPSLIRVGQRLRLNADAPEQASVSDSGSSMAAARQGEADPAPRADDSGTRANDATILNLVWPTKGTIIQKFTVQNKGIDIAGNVGEPVLAAAAGKVAYSGNGARGFGNLVILDHDNGFITAYAHNEKLLVKAGDSVKKGTQVATMGQSDTSSPRLHFEVRRNGTPVDPMRYLPAQQ